MYLYTVFGFLFVVNVARGQYCGQSHLKTTDLSNQNWSWGVQLGQCQGTLIHERFVLTAAHCFTVVYNRGFWPNLQLGSQLNNTRCVRRIKSLRIHPRYTNSDLRPVWDLALLEIDPCPGIMPVCLPNRQLGSRSLDEKVDNAKEYRNRVCIYFGRPTSTFIRKQSFIHPITKLDCGKTWNQALENEPDIVCAIYAIGTKPYETICRGDSGGGLMCSTDWKHWTLEGVTHWGPIRCSNSQLSLFLPNIFAKVTESMDWIQSVIGA